MHRSRSTAGTLAAAVASIVLTIVTVATGGAPALGGERGRPTGTTRPHPVGCPVRTADTAWGGALA
ncbi:hypothetical protein ACFR97_05290 [Haloplanus litoreus]|uniref:Uncharacterized protein n=1 Tax=Haloplanus litoreus TaxID=767515 RepID=A0ABD6A0N2_9EURY